MTTLAREPARMVRGGAPTGQHASAAISWLSVFVAVLAAGATAIGLFSQGGGGRSTVTTVRGGSVALFGHGIYRYESLWQGAIFRGADAVALVLSVPVLLVTLLLYRRGSVRGALLLLGALAYFVYFYANLAFGAAYNNLYLVYVALFGASLAACLLLLGSPGLQNFLARPSPALPRRGLAVFLVAAGVLTLGIWLSDLVPPLLQGDPPKHLDSATTSVTYTLDLAIITPACIVAGLLVVRRATRVYLLAVALLDIVVMLVPTIIGQAVSQLVVGVSLTTAELVGPTIGFVALGVFASGFLIRTLHAIEEEQP